MKFTEIAAAALSSMEGLRDHIVSGDVEIVYMNISQGVQSVYKDGEHVGMEPDGSFELMIKVRRRK